MRKLFNPVLATVLLVGANAMASNPIYDCYQGFDSFPIQYPETTLKKPFFIIPVTELPPNVTDKGKDKFMILNESGTKLVITYPYIDKNKISLLKVKTDALSFSPKDETATIETEFFTYSNHQLDDFRGYPRVAGENKPLHERVIAQKTVEKNLLDSDAVNLLTFAAQVKETSNEEQPMHNRTYLMLKASLPYQEKAKREAIKTSMEKLKSCAAINATLSDFANKQNKNLKDELKFIDEIMASKKAGGNVPATSTKNAPSGSGASNPNGSEP